MNASTHAKLNDFPDDPSAAAEFAELWNNNVSGWTQQAITGTPWNALYSSNQTFYFNPLVTDIADAQQARVAWFAFPNRILFYLGNYSQSQQWEIADNGVLSDGSTFPEIPNSTAICNGQTTPLIPFGPYGPRGWLDEYCEWSVTRNADGKIVRVDFTCENPEYWFTRWKLNPNRVLELYQQTLDNQSIQLEDLQLFYDGAPVIDPSTGLPAYNPLNKWNSGTKSTATSGGAMHLTSTPNNLATELALAGGATVLRQIGNGDAQALLCCGQCGQPQRNSDPSIGQAANQAVAGSGGSQSIISLANPVGLYIQMPNFQSYELPPDPHLPANAQPSDCWDIIRGHETIQGFPNTFNFILHARFALPQSWIDAGVTFTVGDIMINGNPIQFGAQITQTFQIGLNGFVIAPPGLPQETAQPCVNTSPPNPLPAPQQLQDMNLFDAGDISTEVTKVEQGQPTPCIALLAQFAQQGATVTFPEGGVTATVTNFQTPINGDSTLQLFTLTITADGNAALGDRSVLITNPDGTHGPAAPGLLSVVAPGTLGGSPVKPADCAPSPKFAAAAEEREAASPAESQDKAAPRLARPRQSGRNPDTRRSTGERM